MSDLHLVPELIQSIVKDLHAAKKDHAGTYEKRLEVIRDFIDEALRLHQGKNKLQEVFKKK